MSSILTIEAAHHSPLLSPGLGNIEHLDTVNAVELVNLVLSNLLASSLVGWPVILLALDRTVLSLTTATALLQSSSVPGLHRAAVAAATDG